MHCFSQLDGLMHCFSQLDGLIYTANLCLFNVIVLNTKGNVKTSLMPLKSYYNLQSPETQLKIRQDNKQKAGVYLILNKINGNFYVGCAITNRINMRFRNHLIHRTGNNAPLNRAINKYGLENFSFHIVEYYDGLVHKENLKQNHLKLLERETFYISTLKPLYNILVF